MAEEPKQPRSRRPSETDVLDERYLEHLATLRERVIGCSDIGDIERLRWLGVLDLCRSKTPNVRRSGLEMLAEMQKGAAPGIDGVKPSLTVDPTKDVMRTPYQLARDKSLARVQASNRGHVAAAARWGKHRDPEPEPEPEPDPAPAPAEDAADLDPWSGDPEPEPEAAAQAG